jgi:hypothetical protein
VVAVNDFTGVWADQFLVDAAFADQPARCAVRCGVAVVDLAGGKPAIGHRQHSAVTGGFVRQLRCDQTHAGIRDRPAESPPAHTAFHGRKIEVFDHEVAIAARQLGGELVGGFGP